VAVIAAPGGHCSWARSQGGNHKNTDHFSDRRRPGSIRAGQQPQPARRQHHRRGHPNQHAGTEAVGTAARGSADGYTGCLSRQP
jgi:hypothetical protein